MRDITKVIPRVLAVIPKEEDYLRTSFERILERARLNGRYQPPSFYWEQGAYVLYERFGEHPPDAEWFRELKEIWMGQEGSLPEGPLSDQRTTIPPRSRELDDHGSILPPRQDALTGTDWKLVAAIVVLTLLGIAVYLKAHGS